MDIEGIAKDLSKKYGIAIGHLSNDEEALKVPYIPTGLIQLDMALGIGGFPLGYFIEVFAPEGVGKTTLCLQIVARAQEEGLETAYIDMEHRLDPMWATTLGVDLEKLYFTQPPYGEAALNIAGALVKGGVSLIVIDSVPALVPKSEYEGQTGDQFVGLLPRMLAQYLRQMTHAMKTNNASVIFINQIRAKIGGMGSLAMGPRQTQPGGWALKHNASVRLDMRRIQTLKTSAGDPYGQKVLVSVKKNSLAAPYRSVEIILRYGIGFDPVDGLIDVGLKLGVIERAGAWYSVAGKESKMQGRDALYVYLHEDFPARDALESKIREIMLHGNSKDNNEG